MAKNGKKNGKSFGTSLHIPEETKRAIIAVVLIIAGIFLSLAAFGIAGIAGTDTYSLFAYLLGVGYFLLPVLFFILAGNALREESTGFTPVKLIASAIFILTGLGFIAVVSGRGGVVGSVIANPTVYYFDVYAALI